MDKKIKTWQNKILTKLILLVGFVSPITLASCYGPAPAGYQGGIYDEDTTCEAGLDDSLMVVSDTLDTSVQEDAVEAL